MRKKIYIVILMLTKENISFVSSYLGSAEDEQAVLLKAITGVTHKLLEGFTIGAKYIEEIPRDYAPANSGFDCYIPESADGIAEGVYIDLRREYPEAFKQELQDFLATYFPAIPPIYPDYAPEAFKAKGW